MNLDKILEVARANIERVGHHVQGVGPCPDVSPTWAYNVGLTELERPEVVIIGVPWPICGHCLNDLVARAKTDGWVTDEVLDRVFSGYPAILKDATEHDDYPLAVAHQVYPDREIRVRQLFWPDPQLRFPWDDGYDQAAFPQLDLSVG